MEARAWLDAIPKSEAQTMLPSEFRTAFRNRLLILHPQLLAHSTCTCGKMVDPYGIHIQKCRLDGNLTNATYNLAACLAEMIRHCGQSVRVEVSGIFNNVDPSKNQRMDLVVFDPGRPTNSLYDVVVTNPVSQEVLTTNSVDSRATRVQERIKERRYKDAASAAGMSLHGLAIEVYGAWGVILPRCLIISSPRVL